MILRIVNMCKWRNGKIVKKTFNWYKKTNARSFQFDIFKRNVWRYDIALLALASFTRLTICYKTLIDHDVCSITLFAQFTICSMSRVLISGNLTRPRGVAVDYEAGHLYWTDEVTGLVLGGVNHLHSAEDPNDFDADRDPGFPLENKWIRSRSFLFL